MIPKNITGIESNITASFPVFKVNAMDKQMKTYKKSSLTIYSTVFLGALVVVLAACNHLNADKDNINPQDQNPMGAFYTSATSPSIVDLSARIHSTSAVSFSIARQPAKGILTAIANGLYQYAAYPTTEKTTDSFVFNALDAGNIILESDTVPIVVQPTPVLLPCSIYAQPDHMILSSAIPGGAWVWIGLSLLMQCLDLFHARLDPAVLAGGCFYIAV